MGDKIDLSKYPSNSNKMKKELQEQETIEKEASERVSYDKVREKPKKVIKGGVQTKGKSAVRIAAEAFLLKDLGMIKNHMWLDVIKPNLKVTSSDILHGLVDVMFGTETNRKKSGERYAYDKVSYNNVRNRPSDRREGVVKPRRSLDLDDLYFDSRDDVMLVIRELEDNIEEYGEANVYELYDAIGISADYTYQKYGWTDLSDARVSRVRGGKWLLVLPKPVYLN